VYQTEIAHQFRAPLAVATDGEKPVSANYVAMLNADNPFSYPRSSAFIGGQ